MVFEREIHPVPPILLRHIFPRIIPLLLFYLLVFLPTSATSATVRPFHTQNQSPFKQIFGLPEAGDPFLTSPGRLNSFLTFDVSNNDVSEGDRSGEWMELDSENYRVNLALRYGFASRYEAGIDIPYIAIAGGTLDNFIEGFHKFFGLPNHNRARKPQNQLLYQYGVGTMERIHYEESESGLGDIRLTGGMQLYDDGKTYPRRLALRTSVKFPTGSSSHFRGSGSTDFALWLSGADDYGLPVGRLTVFGAAGALFMTDGKILKEIQRNEVGFGTVGIGWAPNNWFDVKGQLNGNTAFYHSGMSELGKFALQALVGGSVNFTPDTSLDIAVSEDLIVRTATDVTFHLAIRHTFF